MLVGGATAGCGSSGARGATAHCAGSDATVVADDASIGAGHADADGTADGADDGSGDGSSQGGGGAGDDADGGGADDVGGDEIYVHPPLPWDACAIFDASALDEASVSAGLLAVEYYGCPICHERKLGRDDAGNLVLHLDGNNLGRGVYPPNLTNSPDGLGCWSNTDVVQAVLFGIDPEGGPLCPPMPVWSRLGMEAGTAAAIVDFLRSLPPSENVVPDTTCAPLASDGGQDAASD